jgi:hypothetical protein
MLARSGALVVASKNKVGRQSRLCGFEILERFGNGELV